MITKMADGTTLLKMGKGTLYSSVVRTEDNIPLGIAFSNNQEKLEEGVIFHINSIEGLSGFMKPIINLMEAWNTEGNEQVQKAIESLRKDMEPFFPKAPIQIKESVMNNESAEAKKVEKKQVKIIKSDFVLIQEAFAEGRGVAMTNTVERKRTELNEQLSSCFRTQMPRFNGVVGEDDVEDVLDSINGYIVDKGIDIHPLSLPLSSGTDIYLIPITPHLSLRVLVADEYHGSGESSTYVMIEFFIIDEQATETDVEALIEMLHSCEIQ